MADEQPKLPPVISLRRFELSDVDHMMEWMSDAHVSRYTTWETITTREAALEYLKTTVFPHPWYQAICLDGKPVGFLSVKPGSGIFRCRAVVGCSLARKHWGRGIAAAAVKMMARDVFGEFPHLERLDALVMVENTGGQRTLEKAGFNREFVHSKFCFAEGKLCDMARYSLFRADSKL